MAAHNSVIIHFTLYIPTVHKVEVNGEICAGKKIHEELLNVSHGEWKHIHKKYQQECKIMSSLQHSNLTQFCGLCFLPDSKVPILLMERLEGSLDNLLETVPNILLSLKRSILEDVARALMYLHTHKPQIIHRDLTAKNVLLTSSLMAKVSDFGNARIIDLQSGQLSQTPSRMPGTILYMPPEAFDKTSSYYGPSLDIFSFGHLALFVGVQV